MGACLWPNVLAMCAAVLSFQCVCTPPVIPTENEIVLGGPVNCNYPYRPPKMLRTLHVVQLCQLSVCVFAGCLVGARAWCDRRVTDGGGQVGRSRGGGGQAGWHV